MEDLGIEAYRERERERERETRTHTHTHTTFQRDRKETRERKTCRKGRSLVVSFAKVWKKKPNNNNNNPTTRTHCFSVVFPPVVASLFLGFDIYLFLRWEMGVEILLGGQFLLNRLLLVFVEKQDIQNFRISILELCSIHSCFFCVVLCCVLFYSCCI